MRKRFLFLFICILLLGIHHSSRAQDPHFTQFFASPLTLNPAFTGSFSGDIRVAANYRNQWAQIAIPYVTGTFSADMNILKNRLPYKDRLGVGILALYDREAGGGLKTTYGGISTAYHLGLDEEGLHSIAVGIQLAYVQKRLDLSKLTFENQLTNLGFDPIAANGEDFVRTSTAYPDLNVGVLYNASIGTFGNLYVGGSYYHANEPDQSFLAGHQFKLHNRWTLHGGGGWAPTPKTRVYLSGLYMQQAGARELAAGGAFGMVFNGDPMDADLLYIGAWYRHKDAINPYIGLEIKTFHVGVSYDINISDLHSASNYRGGLELSLIYIPQKNTTHSINCPKF